MFINARNLSFVDRVLPELRYKGLIDGSYENSRLIISGLYMLSVQPIRAQNLEPLTKLLCLYRMIITVVDIAYKFQYEIRAYRK